MLTVLVAVLPAVVGLIGGVAAGLIPSLVLTGRGRRVRAVRDAVELVKEVTADEVRDPAAEEVLRLALLREALEYKRWVDEPPEARRNRISFGMTMGLLPFTLFAWIVSQITGDGVSEAFTLGFTVLYIAGGFVIAALSIYTVITALSQPLTVERMLAWTPFRKTRARYRDWKARRAGVAGERGRSTAEPGQSPPPTDPEG